MRAGVSSRAPLRQRNALTHIDGWVSYAATAPIYQLNGAGFTTDGEWIYFAEGLYWIVQQTALRRGTIDGTAPFQNGRVFRKSF